MDETDYSAKARNLITARLDRAARLTEADLFTMNLNLPPAYKYQSIREVQTIMVKGAFDALSFSVELGLFTKPEATAFWQELHRRFGQLWPEGSVS
jgi:uncharacterized protein YlaN (UPF0358 family)